MSYNGTIFGPRQLNRAYSNMYDYIRGVIDKEGAENFVAIGIRNGGALALNRLVAQGNLIVPYGFIDPTPCRDDYNKKHLLPKGSTDIPNIDNKHIILVDSIFNTGRNARAAISALLDYGRPTSIKLVVLCKRKGHEMPIRPDFAAFLETDVPESDLELQLKVEGNDHFLVLN